MAGRLLKTSKFQWLIPARIAYNWLSRTRRLPEHIIRIQRLDRQSDEERFQRLGTYVPTKIIRTFDSLSHQPWTPLVSSSAVPHSSNIVKNVLFGVEAALTYGAGALIPIISHMWRKSLNARLKKEQEKEAIVLQPIFERYRDDKETWVKFSVNMFFAFNSLLMRISVDGCTEAAIKLFAEEINSRVLNAMMEKGYDLEYSLEMCAVRGKPTEASALIDFHCNDGSVRHKVKLSTIIDQAGLITIGTDSPIYYNPTGIEPLFYRPLFVSETIDPLRYTVCQNPPLPNEKDSYIVSPSQFEVIVASILDSTIDSTSKLEKNGEKILELLSSPKDRK